MSINLQFKLKEPKALVESSIRITFYLNGERYVYGTGSKIQPELWDFQNQRPHTIKRTNGKDLKKILDKYRKINHNLEVDLDTLSNKLNNLETYTKMYFHSLEASMMKPSKIDYKVYMNSKIKPSQTLKKEKIGLVKYIASCTEDMLSKKRLIRNGKRQGQPYGEGTVKNYNTLKAKLIEYQNYKSISKLNFKDISLEFYDDFLKFIIYEQDNSSNYFGTLIKNLKAVLQWGQDDDLHNFEDYKKSAFAKLQEDVDKVYLTEEELTAMYNLKLVRGSQLDKIRDVFICGCYTAQRFGDYSRIQKRYINFTEDTIEFAQNKGGEKVSIPIAKRVKEILIKYDYNLPVTELHKVNIHIKEIARMSGLTNKTVTSISNKGKRVEVELEKYKLITSHTARRTGCTLMSLSDLSLNEIKLISGHRSLKTLQIYLKTTSKQNAKIVAKNKFFQS